MTTQDKSGGFGIVKPSELMWCDCHHRTQILASITHGLSNGLIESVNTKIRLITRIAFGFAHPGPLIARQ